MFYFWKNAMCNENSDFLKSNLLTFYKTVLLGKQFITKYQIYLLSK